MRRLVLVTVMHTGTRSLYALLKDHGFHLWKLAYRPESWTRKQKHRQADQCIWGHVQYPREHLDWCLDNGYQLITTLRNPLSVAKSWAKRPDNRDELLSHYDIWLNEIYPRATVIPVDRPSDALKRIGLTGPLPHMGHNSSALHHTPVDVSSLMGHEAFRAYA